MEVDGWGVTEDFDDVLRWAGEDTSAGVDDEFALVGLGADGCVGVAYSDLGGFEHPVEIVDGPVVGPGSPNEGVVLAAEDDLGLGEAVGPAHVEGELVGLEVLGMEDERVTCWSLKWSKSVG